MKLAAVSGPARGTETLALRRDIERWCNGKPPIGKLIQIELGPEDHLVLDGTGDSNVVRGGTAVGAVSLRITAHELHDILAGRRTPEMGFLIGRMSTHGSVFGAQRLFQFFRSATTWQT
jgi:hypothetical protein